MVNFEDYSPELKRLNSEIESAYRGVRFLETRGSQEEYNNYCEYHERLVREKELLLKYIFGL